MNPFTQKSGYINQVSSKHEEPEPCRTLPKPTPAEALKLGIKLPWTGKVQQVDRDMLTKELFISLEEYGLTRDEIRSLFTGLSVGGFYGKIKAWDLPPAPTGRRKKNEATTDCADVKKPIELQTYRDTLAYREKLAAQEKAAEEVPAPVNSPEPPESSADTLAADAVPDPELADLLGLIPDASPEQEEYGQLCRVLMQGAGELGKFAEAGLSLGILVQDKQAQYGDMISAMGPLLRVLYLDGISPAQYDDLALVIRICDKLGRISRGNGQGDESPFRDIAGYGLLGAAGQQRKKGL